MALLGGQARAAVAAGASDTGPGTPAGSGGEATSVDALIVAAQRN